MMYLLREDKPRIDKINQAYVKVNKSKSQSSQSVERKSVE